MTTCNGPSPNHFPTPTDQLSAAAATVRGLQRIARAFVQSPETVLQELADAAVELCGADSAGILIEDPELPRPQLDSGWWRCTAAAGQDAHLRDLSAPLLLSDDSLGSVLPEAGVTLPYPAPRCFFTDIGLEAPERANGLVLPWRSGSIRGLLWIASQTVNPAVEVPGCGTVMRALADFASVAVRNQQQQRALMERAAATAIADLANDLAHQINNPLQAMTNVAYLAAEGQGNGDARTLGRTLSSELKRLSALVNKLLALPGRTAL